MVAALGNNLIAVLAADKFFPGYIAVFIQQAPDFFRWIAVKTGRVEFISDSFITKELHFAAGSTVKDDVFCPGKQFFYLAILERKSAMRRKDEVKISLKITKMPKLTM